MPVRKLPGRDRQHRSLCSAVSDVPDLLQSDLKEFGRLLVHPPEVCIGGCRDNDPPLAETLRTVRVQRRLHRRHVGICREGTMRCIVHLEHTGRHPSNTRCIRGRHIRKLYGLSQVREVENLQIVLSTLLCQKVSMKNLSTLPPLVASALQ